MPTATADTVEYALFGTDLGAGGFSTFGDGSFPIRLPDSRLAWLFSDSGVKRTDGGVEFVHNQVVVESADGTTLQTYAGGTNDLPTSLIQSTTTGNFYWISSAFVENSSLQVFAHEYQSVPGSWPTDLRHTVLVALPLTGLKPPGTPWTVSAQPSAVTAAGLYVTWGHSVTKAGSYVYMFGDCEEPVVGWFPNYWCYLARVPVGQSHTASAWRFWNGTAWVSSVNSAVRIKHTDGTDIAQRIGHVVSYGGKWQALHIGIYDDKVQMMEGTFLQGPYAAPSPIYTVPSAEAGNVYLPRGVQDGTQLQIAYSRTNDRPNYARL